MLDQLTDDQIALRDAIERFFDKEHDFEQRRKHLSLPTGSDMALQTALADLGMTALAVPEEHDGLGTGLAEVALTMQAAGRTLLLEPLLWGAIMPALLLGRFGSAAQKADQLPGIAAGERTLALALSEPRGGQDLSFVETTATSSGDGFTLTGKKIEVWDGSLAQALIVTSRVDGELAFFLVPSDADGVTMKHFRSHDGLRLSELDLNGVSLGPDTRIGGDGAEMLDWLMNRAAILQCHEAIGAMDRLFDLLLEHLQTRMQFNKPLGAFQVLQHRASDMYVARETARALCEQALEAVETGAENASRLVSAAKVTTNDAADLMGREAVQLHGGLGITEEHPVSHYFRRLEAFCARCGTREFHLGRFVALSDTN